MAENAIPDRPLYFELRYRDCPHASIVKVVRFFESEGPRPTLRGIVEGVGCLQAIGLGPKFNSCVRGAGVARDMIDSSHCSITEVTAPRQQVFLAPQ
jgi:hypothetical protein